MVLVFVMHNLEEIAHLPQDVARIGQRLDRLGVPAEWGRRDVMAVATTMLTGSSYAVLARAERRPGAVGDVATLAVAAALGGHAVTHGLRAAADRAYNGGLATSPWMLGASVQLAGSARRRGRLSVQQASGIAAAANIAVPVLIVGSLATARTVVGCLRRTWTRCS